MQCLLSLEMGRTEHDCDITVQRLTRVPAWGTLKGDEKWCDCITEASLGHALGVGGVSLCKIGSESVSD